MISMTFTEFTEQIITKINNDTHLYHELITRITDISKKVYNDALKHASDVKYCLSFTVPERDVIKLLDLLSIDEDDLKVIFDKDLGFPKNSYMYGLSYYQILLLLYYIFVRLYSRTKNSQYENIAKLCLFLILVRIWNGRKYRYIKYCNQQIMDYVIFYKMTKKNLVTKFKSPLDLISYYFVETIHSKYSDYIIKDYKNIKLLFNQSFVRIDQLFNNRLNTGLANLYYDVYQKGEGFDKSSTTTSDIEYLSTSIESDTEQILKLVNTVVSSIIYNTPEKLYNEQFLQFLNKKTKVSRRVIDLIVQGIHDITYREKIQELLTILLNRFSAKYSKDQLCTVGNQIYSIADRLIVSSKHQTDVETYKQIAFEIINDIFVKKFGKEITDFAHRYLLIRVLTYVLVYNIVNVVCRV